MKIKDKLIVIIAIIAVIIVCILYPTKQVYLEGDEDFNKVISYSFSYNEKQNMDDILRYQKYIYTEDKYEDYLEDYLAIILCKDNKAYLNHYKVFYTNGEVLISNEIDLSISSNYDFIISLPDRIKNCSWSIKEEESTIQPIKQGSVEINSTIKNADKYGRENLYFNSGNGGKETITLSYSDESGISIKEIILKINIK